MYGEMFYGRHTAQHQLQWREIKIKPWSRKQYTERSSVCQ